MRRSLAKSNAHFKSAVKKLPLGVSSNFRYWGEGKTIYVDHGKGGRFWDLDGNCYIDYRLGYGPVILGHCHDEVDAAAREGQKVGTVFALGTAKELTVAELISKMNPGAELVRFSNSGTEAVMAALRIARAYTGKDNYVIVEGAYHGLFDGAMWLADLANWRPGEGEPRTVPYGTGIPHLVRQLFWQIPTNDANRVEELFKKHAGEIAAFLIEPIMGNCCSIMVDRQYLKDVRQLCDKYEVLLIIDEVKSGFRVAKGGAQELYGVTADLMTFAKAMGNGYPISAVAGREEVMRIIGGSGAVAHGGTYTAHAMSLGASECTLTILSETDTLDTIAHYGQNLRKGMSEILEDRGVVHSFSGPPAMQGLFFREEPPRNYRDWKTSDYTFYDHLAQHLIDLGVACEPDSREPWFICAAHDPSCLDETLTRFEEAVDATLGELTAEQSRVVRKAEKGGVAAE